MALTPHPFAVPKKSVSQQAGRRLSIVCLLPLLSLAAVIGMYCGGGPANGPTPPVRSKAPVAIPAALRATYIQSRQREGGADYAFQVQPTDPSTVVARNPVHGVEATVDAQGLRLRHARRADDLPFASLTLQHYGCAAAPWAGA